MKKVQRKFGGMMKRSANEADVEVVLTEFKAVDSMLDKLIKDVKDWRNGWEDVLRLQYDASEAFANLYKGIEPATPQDAADMRHAPAETPAKYMQKCLGLQKLYSDLKTDLAQEIGMVDVKLLRPAEEAKRSTKGLYKTLKHRENTKLDYERYLSRADHARKKETRSAKEEVALATHEGNLAQAQIDYQIADDQVKQTFPPVTDAVLALLPYLLASQVMLQTTLVGQLYTVLDTYTKTHRMANPAPSDGEIVEGWDREFTGFRKELEQGISVLAGGKAVRMGMTVQEKEGGTLTGLGLRNKAGGLGSKAGGMMHRKGSGQSAAASGMPERPMLGDRQHTGSGRGEEEEEELAPPKPPRPGTSSSQAMMSMPSPGIPMGSKPGRIPSSGLASPNGLAAQWERKPASTALSPSWPPNNHNGNNSNNPPPPYDQTPTSTATTPPSRYQTPINGSSPVPMPSPNDYFTDVKTRRSPSTTSSLASSAAGFAAAKKKPPPPIPAKRFPSGPQPPPQQYVTALYDFEGQNAGDLVFREGDRIRVVKKTESLDDWWDGEVNGRVGVFPANYVRV